MLEYANYAVCRISILIHAVDPGKVSIVPDTPNTPSSYQVFTCHILRDVMMYRASTFVLKLYLPTLVATADTFQKFIPKCSA